MASSEPRVQSLKSPFSQARTEIHKCSRGLQQIGRCQLNESNTLKCCKKLVMWLNVGPRLKCISLMWMGNAHHTNSELHIAIQLWSLYGSVVVFVNHQVWHIEFADWEHPRSLASLHTGARKCSVQVPGMVCFHAWSHPATSWGRVCV